MDFKIYKDNKDVAVCNHCNKELSCKRGNTSHIRSHHKTCEAKQVAAEKRNDVLRLLDKSERNKANNITGQQSMLSYVKTAPTFATECTKWIVLSKKSFETVENPYFRRMCKQS